MPIKRTYVPPFEDVMGAAQAVGAGEFNERRRREDLALLELGQRDLAQRRALVADQQRQANAIAANQQEQAARMQLAGWEAAMRQGNIQQARQWQLDDRGVARQDELADRAAAADEFDRRQAVQFEQEWQLGGVEAAEKGLNADLAGLLKAKEQLTQEGVLSLGKLLGKWRSIQGARAQMPPDEYSRMITDFADEVQRSGVHDHVKPPPNAADEVKGRVVAGPDGNSYILQPNGEIRPVPPPKPVENKTPATFEERYKDFDTFQKDFDAEAKRILTEREAALDTDTNPDAKVVPPTRDEVLKSLREKFDAYKSIQPVQAPPESPTFQTGQPPKTVLPVAGSTADLSDAEIAIHLQTNGFPPANIDRAAIARHEAAGSQDPILSAAQEQQARRVPDPQPAVEIPRFTAENIDAEYEKLPAGAQYLAPDGQLRTKAAAPPPPKKPIKKVSAKPAKGKDLLANKPDRVRKRSFERDETGRIRKEIETYTDPDTGDTITVEQMVDRDERCQIVGTTVYERRAKAA